MWDILLRRVWCACACVCACVTDNTVNTQVNLHQTRTVSQWLAGNTADQPSRNASSRSNMQQISSHNNVTSSCSVTQTLQGSTSSRSTSQTSSHSRPQTLEGFQRWRQMRRHLSTESGSAERRRCDDDLSVNETVRCASDLNSREQETSDNDCSQLLSNHFCVNCQQLMVSYCMLSHHAVHLASQQFLSCLQYFDADTLMLYAGPRRTVWNTELLYCLALRYVICDLCCDLVIMWCV